MTIYRGWKIAIWIGMPVLGKKYVDQKNRHHEHGNKVSNENKEKPTQCYHRHHGILCCIHRKLLVMYKDKLLISPAVVRTLVMGQDEKSCKMAVCKCCIICSDFVWRSQLACVCTQEGNTCLAGPHKAYTSYCVLWGCERVAIKGKIFICMFSTGHHLLHSSNSTANEYKHYQTVVAVWLYSNSKFI